MSKRKRPVQEIIQLIHNIDALYDYNVFEEPHSSNPNYKFSLANTIREKVLELEAENNVNSIQTVITATENYRNAYNIYKETERKYNNANQRQIRVTTRLRGQRTTLAKNKRANVNRDLEETDKAFTAAYKAKNDAYEKIQKELMGEEAYAERIRRLEEIEYPDTDEDEDLNPDNEEYQQMFQPPPPIEPRNIEEFFDASKRVPSFMDGKEPMCAICTEHLSENELGDVYAVDSINEEYPGEPINCGHKFHKGCIGAWVKYHNNCPLCKNMIKKLRLADEEKDSVRSKKMKI